MLVRWQHPMRGLVPPGDFIAAAESCGVIVPLGRWILHTACQQLVVWAGQSPQTGWTLAVNVSAVQFRQPDFVTQVQTVLAQAGANAARLELELTESQLLNDVPGVIAKMDALRALGVRLSLDVIAEGVELPEQRDALLALGCHHYQGYLFGRPTSLA